MKTLNDLKDKKAKAAALNQLRRMCMLKGSGVLDVPQHVSEKFNKKGAAREELLDFFMNECKLDKARF